MYLAVVDGEQILYITPPHRGLLMPDDDRNLPLDGRLDTK